jgi:hypothetical protein
VPLARAAELAAFEQGLGLYVEPSLHAWLLERPVLLAVVSFLYVWGHLPATVGALVWARLEHPRAFGLARDAFLGTQLVVVAGYLAVPTAPPRMLTGGERASGGLVDMLQSPYAALPSGHVAFAVVVAGIVGWLAPWLRVRAAAALYPLLVTAVVLATANHFWLDAVAGAAAAAAGLGLAVIARTAARQLAIPAPVVARSRDDVGSDPALRPRSQPASTA